MLATQPIHYTQNVTVLATQPFLLYLECKDVSYTANPFIPRMQPCQLHSHFYYTQNVKKLATQPILLYLECNHVSYTAISIKPRMQTCQLHSQSFYTQNVTMLATQPVLLYVQDNCFRLTNDPKAHTVQPTRGVTHGCGLDERLANSYLTKHRYNLHRSAYLEGLFERTSGPYVVQRSGIGRWPRGVHRTWGISCLVERTLCFVA